MGYTHTSSKYTRTLSEIDSLYKSVVMFSRLHLVYDKIAPIHPHVFYTHKQAVTVHVRV
jgi:hypothetical protein